MYSFKSPHCLTLKFIMSFFWYIVMGYYEIHYNISTGKHVLSFIDTQSGTPKMSHKHRSILCHNKIEIMFDKVRTEFCASLYLFCYEHRRPASDISGKNAFQFYNQPSNCLYIKSTYIRFKTIFKLLTHSV